ncbi:MAG: ATP-binding cassette domain-containing protein [Spirochaetes bacterium]|nr:ATP-binding cassette domain-containing protein [Spirochaetota bacterium]
MSEFLVEAENLVKHFPVEKGIFSSSGSFVHAVDGVSLAIRERETLACVGESGCGKSTLGRLLLRLIEPTSGNVRFNGEDIMKLSFADLRKRKRDMQIIFQDPYASLDPRMKISDIVGEPLATHGIARGEKRREQVAELLETVGIGRSQLSRYPHMFSGGQRQRIGIARALALNPRFLVCDEPVSALDVSIQSQVINLLLELREKKRLTYFFISHDLNIVRHISDQVCIMFLGKIMEYGPTREVYDHPLHPYSLFLISAAPIPDPKARYKEKPILQGELPSPVNLPKGCRFHTRCPYAQGICAEEEPKPSGSADRYVLCHFPLAN